MKEKCEFVMSKYFFYFKMYVLKIVYLLKYLNLNYEFIFLFYVIKYFYNF